MTEVLRQRVISGVILALTGVGMLFLPAWAVGLILPVIIIPTQLEFYKFLHMAGIPAFRAIGLTSGVLLSLSVWLAYLVGGDAYVAECEGFVLFLALTVLCVRQLPRKNDPQPIITLACTVLGLLYVPYLFNYFIKLAYTWETPSFYSTTGVTGRRVFIYLLAVVKLTDVGAYFIGSRFGRHKLMPRISPSKTVEGLVGGLAVGMAASLACHFIWHGRMGVLPLGLSDALVLGLLLPVAGVIGDLVESMLKRAAGAKDSSRCFPGLGGILDVLDSLLFSAPILFVYLRWHQ